jgi:hypothetical protein
MRRRSDSQSSIAPVGLDLARGTDPGDEDDPAGALTGSVVAPLPKRRRYLGVIVVGGAVAGCAAILIAAGLSRFGHANHDTTTASANGPETNSASASGSSVSAPPLVPAPSSPGNGVGASTGTVRLDRPSLAGHVWLDGSKVAGTSAVVTCGTHQIKVGHNRKHSIDVPCGGEIAVAH